MLSRFFLRAAIGVLLIAAACVFAQPDTVDVAARAGGDAVLDKSWTTGRSENNHGSQVPLYQALASRISFTAERTGFEPADQLPGHGFSKPALSTTQPPLRVTCRDRSVAVPARHGVQF